MNDEDKAVLLVICVTGIMIFLVMSLPYLFPDLKNWDITDPDCTACLSNVSSNCTSNSTELYCQKMKQEYCRFNCTIFLQGSFYEARKAAMDDCIAYNANHTDSMCVV